MTPITWLWLLIGFLAESLIGNVTLAAVLIEVLYRLRQANRREQL